MRLTTDMGPSNLKLWKAFGIGVGKDTDAQCSIPHPSCPSQRRLWFFPDVIHVFKNVVAGFVSNEVIHLSQATVDKFKLPSADVLICHLRDIFEQEKDKSLRLSYKLQDYLFHLSSFQKMRVSTSTNLINNSSSSSLYMAAAESEDKSLATTAWFVDLLDTWFTVIKSRIRARAFSHSNMASFQDLNDFLKELIDIFCGLKIGGRQTFKPAQ